MDNIRLACDESELPGVTYTCEVSFPECVGSGWRRLGKSSSTGDVRFK